MQDDQLSNIDLGLPHGFRDRPPLRGHVGDGASVGFFEAIRRSLRSSVYGRASRSEFWYLWLFLAALNVFSFVILNGYLDLEQADRAVAGLTSIFTTVAFVRRLHDVNKSGWWILIGFTIIGLIPLFIWSVRRGDVGCNRFDLEGSGPRPSDDMPHGTTAAIDQVERLHRLRLDGAITDEEYQALKKRAL